MLSFWITLSCLVIGIVLLILPTVFLIHWGCRIFIWVCLGPWLRIYWEFFVFEREEALVLETKESRNVYAEKILQKITEQFKELEREARMKGEEAIKMKSMRMLRFGQHIAKVPSMNITRHYDYPLNQSMASHISLVPEHKLREDMPIRIVPSQRLQGHIIPMTEEQLSAFENKSNRIVEENDNSPSEDRNPCRQNDADDTYEPSTTVEWFDDALSHLGSLAFQSRTKVAIPSENLFDDEVIQESIEIDENVLHISTQDGKQIGEEWFGDAASQIGSLAFSCRTKIAISMDDYDDDDNNESQENVEIHITAENLLNNDDDDSQVSNLTDHEYEEEGLEVVQWDDEKSLTVDVSGNVNDEEGTEFTDTTNLSAVYHKSNGVYVTFCRTPLSRAEGNEADQTEFIKS